MTTDGPMRGLDVYTFRARVAPALLAAAPALALGVLLLPLLPGAQKLWALLAVGLATYAALVARRAGNRAQTKLWDAWGGAPTTSRMRFRDNESAEEVERRHHEVERVLGGGLKLPAREDEVADAVAADSEYKAAMFRIVSRVRNNPDFPLLNIENRNYGYARNLLGLKPFGLFCSGGVLATTATAAVALSIASGLPMAVPLLLPGIVAIVAPILWRQVDADFVKPSADAYADRVIDALERLPDA